MAVKTKTEDQIVQQYQKEADGIVADIQGRIGDLGRLLVRAFDELTGHGYKKLEDHLLARLTRSDINAAIAVGEDKLDERLFFQGVASSKILALAPADQERLLDPNETLEVRTPNDTTEYKAWRDMAPIERDRIISGKGGRILSAAEQRIPGETRNKTRRVARFTEVKYSDGVISLSVGKQYGEIEVAVIGTRLSRKQVRRLIQDLQDHV